MSRRKRKEDSQELETKELSPKEAARLETERLEAEGKYFNVSRRLSTSLLCVLPLVAIYEIGVLTLRTDISGVAALVKTPLSWLRQNPVAFLGADAMLLINGLLAAVVVVAALRVDRRGALHAGTFGGMVLEGAVYALLLGPLALAPLTGTLDFGGITPDFSGFFEKLVLSSGAGLYEEMFFRLMLLGSVFFLAKELGGLLPPTAGAVALVLSGVIFSAMHFLGPGETANLGAFLYRLLAGMALGLIFLLRGFGIAAWTHALYDLYVLCLAAG